MADVTTQGDPAAVEAVLARCIERARAAGVAIICGEFEVVGPVPTHLRRGRPRKARDVVGCCALGAYENFAKALGIESLGLPDDDEDDMCAAWEAIESGFDGDGLKKYSDVPGEHPPDWYAVGARLRERYQPVAASTLGGRS